MVLRCTKDIHPVYPRGITNRSINGNFNPRGLGLVQKVEIVHREQAILLFKAFGKIGWAGKTGVESYLGNRITLFLHQFPCFFKAVIF